MFKISPPILVIDCDSVLTLSSTFLCYVLKWIWCWSIAAYFYVSCCMPVYGSSLLFIWLMLEIVLAKVSVTVDAVAVVSGQVFFCVMAL
jgi:hypothetical protein